MKIRYRKKIVNRNLILGVVWLIFGAVQAIFIEDSNSFNYAWFVLSGVYFVLYFNQKNKKYLTIKNGVIKQNWPLGKEMNLKEIKQIKHSSRFVFAHLGSYYNWLCVGNRQSEYPPSKYSLGIEKMS